MLYNNNAMNAQNQSASTAGTACVGQGEINSYLELLSGAHKATMVIITPIGPNGRHIPWRDEPGGHDVGDLPGAAHGGLDRTIEPVQALRSTNIGLWLSTCTNAIRSGVCTVKVLYHGKAISCYLRPSNRKTASLSISFQMPEDDE